jgi:hypothetical protein
MMIRSSTHHMRHRAQLQDDGALVNLALSWSRQSPAWWRSPASWSS